MPTTNASSTSAAPSARDIRCAFGSCPGENGLWTATVRDLGHRVLRTFEQDEGSTWRWKRDHVYRGANLLAAYEPNGNGGENTRHHHLDQRSLATPTTRSAARPPTRTRTSSPRNSPATSAMTTAATGPAN